MPAKMIKIGKDGLVGRVLAYVKEPNEEGTHDAVIAASKVPDLIRLYMQLIGKEETPEAQEFLEFLNSDEEDTNQVGAANYRTTIDDITDLKEIYDCDIIEVSAEEKRSMCAPQPIQEGIRELREELLVSEMYIALDDYFSAYKAAELKKMPFPTYADCTHEEWKDLLLEIHESLVNPSPGLDYDAIENDLQRLCSGSGVPEKVVSELCYVAKNGFKEKVKLLCFYKELILAIEDKRYEDAALWKEKISKVKE